MKLDLPNPVEQKLRERAQALGMEVREYALHLLLMGLDITLRIERPGSLPSTERSLNDILAPVHEDVRESGLSDDELDQLGRELIDEVRQRRLSP
ncbi:MAG: hypothetical protein AB7O52_08180 [Planctomycetota bacterium]